MDTASAQRHRSRNLGEYVKDEPLTALAIATAAGFVLGGGVSRRIGFEVLAMVGRTALRGVATSLIVGMLTGGTESRRPDSKTPGSERHDNGRTNFANPG